MSAKARKSLLWGKKLSQYSSTASSSLVSSQHSASMVIRYRICVEKERDVKNEIKVGEYLKAPKGKKENTVITPFVVQDLYTWRICCVSGPYLAKEVKLDVFFFILEPLFGISLFLLIVIMHLFQGEMFISIHSVCFSVSGSLTSLSSVSTEPDGATGLTLTTRYKSHC